MFDASLRDTGLRALAFTASACGLLALSAPPVRGAAWPDRVGTAEVRPGEATRGKIPLLEYADGSDVEAPVMVFAGRERRGPVAWLLACGHGDEVGGALALQRVAKVLDPATMTGLVVLVPVANPPEIGRASCRARA